MELLLETTFDKLNYSVYSHKIYTNKGGALIFFGYPNKLSLVDRLLKLNIKLSKLKSYYVPNIHTQIKGKVINTQKYIPDILKKIEESKLPIKVIKTLPKKLNENEYIFVDLFPYLYELKELLDKLRYVDKFRIIFDIVNKQARKFGKEVNDFVYPVLYIDLKDENTINFLKELGEFLAKFRFVVPLKARALYFALDDGKHVIYGKLGEYDEKLGALKVNQFAFQRLYKLILRNISKNQNKSDITIKDIEKSVNEIVNLIANRYEIKDNAALDNLRILLGEYLKSNYEILNKVNSIEELLSFALKEVAGINKDLHLLPKNKIKKELENITQIFVKSKTIVPVVEDTYENIYKFSKNLKVKTTVVDRHKREFEKVLDENIYKIFRRIEEHKYPIKILDVKKEIKDDNLSRFYEYTLTLQNANGGEPYTIKIRIPALINDRYFKLNGKTYILTNQIFLKPITKSKPNSVRFLSNYATISLHLKNTKVPFSDINAVLEYIVSKYSNHILQKEKNEENDILFPDYEPIIYKKIFFDTGDVFYGYNPIGNNRYVVFQKYDKDGNLKYEDILDLNENKIVRYFVDRDEEVVLVKGNVVEHIVEKLLNIVSNYNPNEVLGKALKSVPYIQIHVMGMKLPLINYMILNLGVINALNKLQIDYEISDEIDSNAYISILFKDKVVNIYPKTKRDIYIVNGLKLYKLSKYTKEIPFEEFENNSQIRGEIIKNEYGERALKNFKLIEENIIDNITKELLEYEGKSTNIYDLLSKDMIDVLLNNQVSSPVDLRYARARLSEVILNILYKQLAMALNEYDMRKASDENAKLYFDKDYVIRELLTGESTLQFVEPLNPIDELNTATRITPKGIGGVPKNSITLEHRLIPFYEEDGKIVSSFFGNISALDTNEYGNVGVNQQLTYTSLVSDKFGIFGIRKSLKGTTFESLGIGESLAPFVNSIDHDRAIKMAQQMRQTIPIDNPDIPYVMSGAESLIPQMVSRRFVIRAEEDGIIEDIKEDEYIVVRYSNGKRAFIDIKPRLARTKRGLFVPLKLKINKQVGERFKKGEILASTSQFNSGFYTYGKNVVVALSQYDGGTYEDGWVVCEDTLKKFTYPEYKEITVLIPKDAKIVDYNLEEGKVVDKDELLLSFTFEDTLSKYQEMLSGAQFDSENFEETNESDITNEMFNSIFDISSDNIIKVSAPFKGKIKEIRIYLNSKDVDKIIYKHYKEIISKLKKFIDKSTKINGNSDLSYLDNIDVSVFKIGGHKHKGKEFDGAKIVIFFEIQKEAQEGSKFVFRGGAKGVVTKVIPEDKKPIALDTKLKIDWFFNSLSILGRKSANLLIEIALGKVLFFLNKKVKEMINDKKYNINDIKKLIIDVYSKLDKQGKYVLNDIKDFLYNTPNDKLRQLFKNIDEWNKPLFVFIAKPFTKIDIRDILDACDVLGIPLEEKIYFPDRDAVSNNKVTVGIMYVTMLEHEPDSMYGVRSTGKYQYVTGQGLKGESRNVLSGKGAIRVDELTATALFDYFGKDSKVLEELYTVQADDFVAKEDVLFKIIQTGKAPESYKRSETKTKKLLRNYFYALGLDPEF